MALYLPFACRLHSHPGSVDCRQGVRDLATD
jgi:hypothetical protein